MAGENRMDSPNILARIAAVLFVIVVFQGMSAELVLRPDILVPGDSTATFNNMIASESLFRLSVVSDLIRQMFLVFLALVAYRLFKPVDRSLAGVMVIFALLSTPINMLNEMNHFAALLISTGALPTFGTDQSQDLVMFFLKLREYGTNISGIFSLWILLLGYLAFKSLFVPRILGIWLTLGGIAYVTAAILFYVLPNFDATPIGLFAFVGEAVFYLWLLIRGVNVEQWRKRTL
jgi:hypothetical protein